MNYQDIKDTHEDMTDAIRRHNEAVADRITAEFARPERISLSYLSLHPENCPVIERTADGVEVGVCAFYLKNGVECPRHGHIGSKVLDAVQNRQRAQIQSALEALHRGNLDDVKRILEGM